MDRAFWKTVFASALGALIALLIGHGAERSGLPNVLGHLDRLAAVEVVKPTSATHGPAEPTPARPTAAEATPRTPPPEGMPNGSLPAWPAAPGVGTQPRAVRGDVLVINPVGGGPRLLTNVPEAAAQADLPPEERAQREAELKRKETAWRKFYERPAGCDKAEGPALVECANHYIRAKRSFDTLYSAGKL